MKGRKAAAITAAAVLAVFAVSCATLTFYKKVDNFVAAGDFAAAGEVIEKEKKQYKGNHELLYYFDRGAVLQMAGEYSESTRMLNEAEYKIEDLFTKSVTQEVGAFLSNDLNLPYAGEDFEQVMVHILKALNFMYAGDFQGARVESRKINHRLNMLTDRLEGKNIYQEDAFARYLSAMIYEALGERDAAYIDYRKAYEAYKHYQKLYGMAVPEAVRSDVLRLADAVRDTQRMARYRKEWGEVAYEKWADTGKKGEAVIIVYDGMAPYKSQYFFNAPIKDKDGKQVDLVRVAFPKFVPRGHRVETVTASSRGVDFSGFLAQDLNLIAVKNLENKILLISAKAIARAIAKHQAKRAISGDGKNEGLGLLMSVYNIASEQADTRCWRTLPARFHILRARLNPGKHELKVKVSLAGGGTAEKTLNVHIKPGRKEVMPVFMFN
ncbi:MAG TPA: hypothetical protein ENN43_03765 [bacterium]|nr:hypothetical protein [bacterium]